MKIKIAALFILAAVSLGGCFLFSDEEAAPSEVSTEPVVATPLPPESPTPETLTTVPIEGAKTAEPETNNVEILWLVPETPVDGYLIRYGFSRESLELEKRIVWKDIERRDDARYGQVFRFMLEALPSKNPVYVSIAAIQGETISTPTAIFEVKP